MAAFPWLVQNHGRGLLKLPSVLRRHNPQTAATPAMPGAAPPTGATLVDSLRSLPDPSTDAFLVASREWAAQVTQSPETLGPIVRDAALDPDIRLRALYILLFHLRRTHDFREYRAWVDSTRAEFSTYPLFYTFDVAYERSLGDDRRSMDRALRAATRAVESFPDSPGVLHQFGEVAITAAELYEGIPAQVLRDAEAAVDRAISLAVTEQPHYWATRARLQAHRGDFSAARRSVAEAIEAEPSNGPHYAVRVTEYQLVQMRVTFMEERERIERRDREVHEEFLSIRQQLISVLGLLAAVIAFITTTVQIATRTTFSDAARLLVMTGAMILLIFSGFSYAFRIANGRRGLAMSGLGLVLLFVALSYPALARHLQ